MGEDGELWDDSALVGAFDDDIATDKAAPSEKQESEDVTASASAAAAMATDEEPVSTEAADDELDKDGSCTPLSVVPISCCSPAQQSGDSTGGCSLSVTCVGPSHKDLPETHRFGAYIALKALSLSKDRAIEKKDKELVADLLKTSVRTVERIWKKANDQLARGEEVDLSSKKKGRCGRKSVDLDLSRISSIPLDQRSSFRALARSLDVPYSTLHRKYKMPHKRPQDLSETRKQDNKIARLDFRQSN